MAGGEGGNGRVMPSSAVGERLLLDAPLQKQRHL